MGKVEQDEAKSQATLPAEPQKTVISEPQAQPKPTENLEDMIAAELEKPVTDQPVAKKRRGRPPGSKSKPALKSEPTPPPEPTSVDRSMASSVILMYQAMLVAIGGQSCTFNADEKTALTDCWAGVFAAYNLTTKNLPLLTATIVTGGITIGKIFAPESIEFRRKRKSEKLAGKNKQPDQAVAHNAHTH